MDFFVYKHTVHYRFHSFFSIVNIIKVFKKVHKDKSMNVIKLYEDTKKSLRLPGIEYINNQIYVTFIFLKLTN